MLEEEIRELVIAVREISASLKEIVENQALAVKEIRDEKPPEEIIQKQPVPMELQEALPAGFPPPPVGQPPQTAEVPSSAPPIQAVPTLDDIRILANDIHRDHADRVSQVMAVLHAHGSNKLTDLSSDTYPEVHAELQRILQNATH